MLVKNVRLIFILLLLIGILVFFFSLFSGPVKINISSLFNLNTIENSILFSIRFPRIINAFLVGALLAISGLCFQGALKNPLADPYVLGISAGAGLGVAAVFFANISFNNILLIPLAAFLSSLITIILLFTIIKFTGRENILHFILAGIIINAFFSSITLLLLFFANQKLSGIMFWLMGDLGKSNLNLDLVIFLISFPLLIFLFFNAYKLNIICQSDEVAYSLGIEVKRFRKVLIVIASVLTSFAVSLGGIIGFIGLVIPHFLRLVLKDDFRFLFPLSFLFGGIFLVFSDTLARSLFSYSEIPVGVITSFIGAPFFLWLFIKSSQK